MSGILIMASSLGSRLYTEVLHLNVRLHSIRNLKEIPEIENPDSPRDLFVEGLEGINQHFVWQFRLPARHISERRIPFLAHSDPIRTFRSFGSHLVATTNRRPDLNLQLHRVLERTPSHSNQHIHMGPWIPENLMSTQYQWEDGTMLLNSSTPQLRLLQVFGTNAAHGAVRKWEVQLGCRASESIWQATWISYRSAAENTFMGS